MGSKVTARLRFRRDYSKFEKPHDIPNLIQIQWSSYHRFLQPEIDPDEREDFGLQAVFKSVFPIRDYNETASLEFVSYSLGEPKYDFRECSERGMTWAAPLKVTVQLVLWDASGEEEVYFGEIPLMTQHGTFMVNGSERVVVSQLHRSPGVFFDHDKGKSHSSGKLLYNARIIPYRGSWLDLEFDVKDVLHVRIDRRRKQHATILLRAFGMSTEEIIHYFYKTDIFSFNADGTVFKEFKADQLEGQRVVSEIKGPGGRVLAKAGQKFNRAVIRRLTDSKVTRIEKTLMSDGLEPELDNLAVHMTGRSQKDALIEIYKHLRPGDPPRIETAETNFNNLFFNPERYDLSAVGRLKIGRKKDDKSGSEFTEGGTLSVEDICLTVKYLLELRNSTDPLQHSIDDIDHLGNRRVRSAGELVENQYRIGLVRMERAIKERMSIQDIETLMPQDLINYKPVAAAIKEFYGSSQLSQFMDQTNPLGEITHKRRLSALGPGGLTRERAGFEVRDVHLTHYGRVCPIETPEGPNIGLISSLATYARVNNYGFVETPYRIAKDGRVTDDIRYLTAMEEAREIVAQGSTELDPKGDFTSELVSARRGGEFVMVPKEDVTLMDVSPSQLVSVAASLIPFLENDDANRALMGSNMQRQAVPLLRTTAPLVGTGMERVVARDSGATVVAHRGGLVQSVDAERIVVKA
ncbi:UNVERIFIED_CONTAM: hypothetical protein GTU68_024236, partial [Idotea baltica]|nr:hypothetical protein [Idotea baltica]